MITHQTLRVHNAMVTDRMQATLNRMRAGKRLGRIPGLAVQKDRNALAFHYIESGAIGRFSSRHKIAVKAG